MVAFGLLLCGTSAIQCVMSEKAFPIEKISSNRHLTSVFLRAGFFYGDLAGDRGVTSRTLKQLGFTDQEMRSGSYQERIHPEDMPVYRALWDRVNEGWEDELYCEYRLRDRRGEWHWVATHAVVTERTASGGIGAVVGTDRSIQSRKQAEAYIRRKFEIAEALRQTTTVVASDVELRENFVLAIAQLRDILEFESGQIAAMHRKAEGWEVEILAEDLTAGQVVPAASVELLMPALEESFSPVIHDDLGPGHPTKSLLAIPLRVRGALVGAVFLWHRTPGFFHGTDLYPVIAFGESIAVAINNTRSFQRALAELELDGLTGFLTRKCFDRNVGRAWPEYCALFASNAVAMIDIDHFKKINDTWGHPTGDAVIRRLAELLKASFRKEDTLGRYGGEEVVAVLPNTTAAAAHTIMERVRAAAAALDFCDFAGTVTISIGIATTEGDCDLVTAMETADMALYQAKKKGRNRVEVAS